MTNRRRWTNGLSWSKNWQTWSLSIWKTISAVQRKNWRRNWSRIVTQALLFLWNGCESLKKCSLFYTNTRGMHLLFTRFLWSWALVLLFSYCRSSEIDSINKTFQLPCLLCYPVGNRSTTINIWRNFLPYNDLAKLIREIIAISIIKQHLL